MNIQTGSLAAIDGRGLILRGVAATAQPGDNEKWTVDMRTREGFAVRWTQVKDGDIVSKDIEHASA